MLSYKRSVRVAELIQKEIARIIQELKSPDIGFVTVTGVKLTDDLLDARIFYSVMGSAQEIERTKSIVEDSSQHIRWELGSRLNLRRTPTLTFTFDDTPERAAHVFELLEKIKEEDSCLDSKAVPRTKKKKKR